MPSIGSLAVQLSLDAALFTSGLDRSTKQGQAFASTITKAFSGIGAGIAGLEGAGGGIASLYQGFKSGLDEIIETDREAKRLGLSLDALGGLHLLLGKDAETAGHAFQHFSAHLSEAATSGGEALKPFAQLGIDIKELQGLSFDKSLGKVADKLNALSANDRNALGKELFGREGPAIIADLERGSKGIAEATERIRAHGGIGFDPKGAAAALEARRSITEMESSFNRIKLSLISEFAPVVKNVADWISDMAGDAGGGLKKTFHDAALSLVDGLGAAVEFSEKLLINIHDLSKPLEPLLKLAPYLLAPSPALMLYNAVSGTGQNDTFARDVLARGKAFQDYLQAARNTINGVGGGKLHGDAAGTASLFDFDKFKKLGEEAAAIVKETESPLDKFNEKFGKLKELLDAGKLTPDQYATALAKDFATLEGKQKELHAPGALEQGSAAAHSEEVRFQREQGGHGSAIDRIEAIFKEIKEQDAQQLRQARELVAAIKDRLVGRPITP